MANIKIWATDSTNVEQPSEAKYSSGFSFKEELPSAEHNYLLNAITTKISNLEDTVAELQKACPFPINSIIHIDQSFNPNTIWADTTWVKIENRFLLGSGNLTNSATGGNFTIKLNKNQLPEHNHFLAPHNHTTVPHSHGTQKHSHTMLEHSHLIKVYNDAAESSGSANGQVGPGSYNSNGTFTPATLNTKSSMYSASVSINNTTVSVNNNAEQTTTEKEERGEAIDITPPYYVVTMWKRTK